MRMTLATLLAATLALGACSKQVKDTPSTVVTSRGAAVDVNPLSLDGSPSMGPRDAKVTIVVSTDFQCPYCSKLAPVMHQLRELYPREVRVVLKHNPLAFHKRAMPTAKATMAAHAQGEFWAYHDLVFANPKALEDADLEAHAKALGLDIERWRKDMESEEVLAKIRHDQASMVGHGARGTPTSFINGKKFAGARPLETFRPEVDAAIAEADALLAKGTIARDLHAALAEAHATKTYVDSVILGGTPPDPPPPPPRKKTAPRPDPNIQHVIEIHPDDPFMGPADAAVVLVEFSDFQCPFCKRLSPTLKALVEAYPKDLKLVFKQQPLPFHEQARPAAMAALAAHAQGKFWAYHDLLFEDIRALGPKRFERYARELNLNMKAFRRFVSDGAGEAHIARDQTLAAQIGARGTPTSYVNGYIITGAQPIEAFKALIDRELAKVK
ncbi:MAG: thioredoxin domain-containing protein [Myxococcota bacterium]|nr:thioredoxin domain-containing protein [Myxococcota bacterium]